MFSKEISNYDNLVLMYDQDKALSLEVCKLLQISGFKVFNFDNQKTTLDFLKKSNSHVNKILLLGLYLDNLEGIEICRELRSNSDYNNVKVVMLLDQKDIMLKYLVLDSGADYYIDKPFSPIEILINVKIISKSINRSNSIKKEVNNNYEPIERSYKSSNITVNEKNVKLTPIEADIFYYLYDNSGKLVTTEEILINVMKYPKGVGSPELIRTHIKNIRAKIEVDRTNPEIITHIPKRGYKINKMHLSIDL